MKLIALGFIFLLGAFVACRLNEPSAEQAAAHSLKLLNTFDLQVPEPSGLTLNPSGTRLWTVSDQTNRVYELDLQGQVLQTLPFQGQDLEGIAYDSLRNVLWIVEEKSRELIKLSLQGTELERHKILEGNDNSGLEGIAIDGQHTFYCLKEKNPGLLLVLNPDFTIKQQLELDFAADYSALWADTSSAGLWILSDQDQALYFWNLQSQTAKKYRISVTKPEGLAIDFNRSLAYVVSDAESRLFVFDFTF